MIIEVSIRSELPLLDAIESNQVRNPVSACVPLRFLHEHSRGVAAVCGGETVFVVQVCAGTLWKSVRQVSMQERIRMSDSRIACSILHSSVLLCCSGQSRLLPLTPLETQLVQSLYQK